jgi:CSLREA domain-containing protein
MRRLLPLLCAALVAAVCTTVLAAPPGVAGAKTFRVNTTRDGRDGKAGDGRCRARGTGRCTLRAAITEANALTGLDTVRIPAGTYVPRACPPAVRPAIRIVGAGARRTVIDLHLAAMDCEPAFVISGDSAGRVRLRGVTITRGEDTEGAGGITVMGGRLILVNSMLIHNSSADASLDVWPQASVAMSGSTISGDADGGLELSTDPSSLRSSIVNSTITRNASTGIDIEPSGRLQGPPLLLRNTTIAGNGDGGIAGRLFSDPDLGGPGPWDVVELRNSIVANNGGRECRTGSAARIISAGHALTSDQSCGFRSRGDKEGRNPRLGRLRNNGGPTNTRALLPGSPAIDAAGLAGCPRRDQRGLHRPKGRACDIGAIEALGRHAARPR